MIRYIGGGQHEFFKESGEVITLSDRDIINLRIDMQMQGKEYGTQMSDLMDQSRREKPSTRREKPSTKKAKRTKICKK